MKESKAHKFDLENSTLEGINLIEASAGTGKTYTIESLFLRLILEKNLTVDQILVVTFTEAATAELIDRIRSKIRTAIDPQNEDTGLIRLLQKYIDREKVVEQLKTAIRNFDEAAIFTIHGFCKRVLHEQAFESGSLFDTELVTDQDSIIQEIVDDFWRNHVYHASPLFVNYALHNGFSADNLVKLLGKNYSKPGLRIIPQIEESNSEILEQEFQHLFNKVAQSWHSAREEVRDLLLNSNLSKTNYKEEKVLTSMEAMDFFLQAKLIGTNLPNQLKFFTNEELEKAQKKGSTLPSHSFFNLVDEFVEAQQKLEASFEQRILALKIKLFNFIRQELPAKKQKKNVQGFDDLLLNLQKALNEPGGNDLAQAVRRKYKAALIDEFQDTDQVQYDIFKRIFNTKDSILFLIGDPKQAIYGFRGADIFAYMDAARHAEHHHTLDKNWRSEPDLISAVNTIFENTENSFVYEDIPFEPVSAPEKENRKFLNLNSQLNAPFQLWYLDSTEFSEDGKPVTKGQAKGIIPGIVAAEISHLLNMGKMNQARIGERPLRENDIAVLVRKNDEAQLIQDALRQYRIPSVLYSTADLLESHEALETQRILSCIAEPTHDRLIKAALTTDALGLKGEELELLADDETAWENWLVKFYDYHSLWQKGGFVKMFRKFLFDENVLLNLMQFADGERRVTNMLHLTEVLHQTAVENKLGIQDLLKWLSDQRNPDVDRTEEHQLRLESDENAVNIVTIHKSKGLEYPIVFCPFSWSGSKVSNKKSPILFHDSGNDLKVTLDLGSENREANIELAEKEQLAENLRLLYVALTRAKHRCYFVWGRLKDAETSAPAYLFHNPSHGKCDSPVNELESHFKQISDQELIADIKKLAQKSEHTIQFSKVEQKQGETYQSQRTEDVRLTISHFNTQIDRSWRVSSFSSLVFNRVREEEAADYDEVVSTTAEEIVTQENVQTEKNIRNIFTFPRGAGPGIFLHDLFENLDFNEKNETVIHELIDKKLKEYGFDPRWQNTIFDLLLNVINAPLTNERDDFNLTKIENRFRLNELGFYYPLTKITPEKLKSVFSKFSTTGLSVDFPHQIGRLDFSPTNGFIKGYIDLVFQFEGKYYIIDWKSNHLGDTVDHYSQPHLAKTIENEFYFLQYHLYTMALHQYLKVRLPGYNYETHFGGIFYIFLRGVDSARNQDSGIFRDRPSFELIENLCQELM